jgi:hypothetical protein
MSPTTITLNRGLLYHRVKREMGFACPSWACSTSGSSVLSDMLARSHAVRLAGPSSILYASPAPHNCASPATIHISTPKSSSQVLQRKCDWLDPLQMPFAASANGVIRSFDGTILSEHAHRCSRCETKGSRVVLDAKFYLLFGLIERLRTGGFFAAGRPEYNLLIAGCQAYRLCS